MTDKIADDICRGAAKSTPKIVKFHIKFEFGVGGLARFLERDDWQEPLAERVGRGGGVRVTRGGPGG